MSGDSSPRYAVDFRDELVNVQLTDRIEKDEAKPLETINEVTKQKKAAESAQGHYREKVTEPRNKGFTTLNSN